MTARRLNEQMASLTRACEDFFHPTAGAWRNASRAGGAALVVPMDARDPAQVQRAVEAASARPFFDGALSARRDRAGPSVAERRRKTNAGPPATPTPGRPQWLARPNTAGADSRESAAARKKRPRRPPQTTPRRNGTRSDAMADSEDKKPEKKEGGEGSLNIRIRDQTGEETFFKVKKTTKLDKVFNAYSTRKGVAATSLRFLFDGSRVRGEEHAWTSENIGNLQHAVRGCLPSCTR